VKSPSRLLTPIDEDDLDDLFVTYIDHDEDAMYVYSTCYRGLVSGNSYMVMHETEMLSGDCIRALERRELLALEQTTIGGIQ